MITDDSNLQLAFHLVGVFVFTLCGGLVALALVFALRMVAVLLDVHAPKPLRTGEAR